MQNHIENYRWRIVALLFFATTINYIDRQVIGLLKPFIEKDMGWTEISYGQIVTAFQAAYAIGLLISGRFLDIVGTRLGFSIAIVVWSIGGMLHAAARTVFGFGAARFILGIGESANFPASVKTVAEWFPKKERALATGIFNSGSNIGAIVAPIIVTYITLKFGWRWAFIITGMLGFIWLLFWVLLYKIPSKHPKVSIKELGYILSDQEEIPRNKLTLIELFRFRQTYGICLSRFVTEWVWWFFLFWAPDFLKKTHGVNIKEVVLPIIIIYTCASIGGIGGGWISGYFIRKGMGIDRARKTVVLICAIMVLPLVFVPFMSNIWVAVLLISLATAAHQGWASNIFTIASDIFPKNAVGSVTGIAGFFGAVGGAISATVIAAILEFTGSYFLIFALASSAYLIAWLIIKLMIPEITPLYYNTMGKIK
jgi:ACS family hexuronate transporter-like MFS transporter